MHTSIGINELLKAKQKLSEDISTLVREFNSLTPAIQVTELPVVFGPGRGASYQNFLGVEVKIELK